MTHPTGPIPLPSITLRSDAYRAAVQSLTGHATSDRWLPEGLSPECDALRDEHLRRRTRVLEELDALHKLTARWSREDREHREAVEQAVAEARDIDDTRTPMTQRADLRRAREERIVAAVVQLAQTVRRANARLRELEPEHLAALHQRLTPAREKEAEARRLLAEAREDQWVIRRAVQWVKLTTEGGSFAHQPFPEPVPAPHTFTSLSEHEFERLFFEQDRVVRESVPTPLEVRRGRSTTVAAAVSRASTKERGASTVLDPGEKALYSDVAETGFVEG